MEMRHHPGVSVFHPTQQSLHLAVSMLEFYSCTTIHPPTEVLMLATDSLLCYGWSKEISFIGGPDPGMHCVKVINSRMCKFIPCFTLF